MNAVGKWVPLWKTRASCKSRLHILQVLPGSDAMRNAFRNLQTQFKKKKRWFITYLLPCLTSLSTGQAMEGSAKGETSEKDFGWLEDLIWGSCKRWGEVQILNLTFAFGQCLLFHLPASFRQLTCYTEHLCPWIQKTRIWNGDIITSLS